jgi:hypothetical protein
MRLIEHHMQYPWPIANADEVLQDALDIALDYLEFTRQAYPFSEVERACASVILEAWKAGTRHRIRLANYAITTIERTKAAPRLPSFYPKAG